MRQGEDDARRLGASSFGTRRAGAGPPRSCLSAQHPAAYPARPSLRTRPRVTNCATSTGCRTARRRDQRWARTRRPPNVTEAFPGRGGPTGHAKERRYSQTSRRNNANRGAPPARRRMLQLLERRGMRSESVLAPRLTSRAISSRTGCPGHRSRHVAREQVGGRLRWPREGGSLPAQYRSLVASTGPPSCSAGMYPNVPTSVER